MRAAQLTAEYDEASKNFDSLSRCIARITIDQRFDIGDYFRSEWLAAEKQLTAARAALLSACEPETAA